MYLLYSEDLAYYAGEATCEDTIEKVYVISISTLCILAMKDWLNILEPILNSMSRKLY